MKTKELIRQLQELDPSGEIEVETGGGDIYFAERLPAYYDGRLQVLIRDKSKEPYYDIVGMKIFSSGQKISLKTMSLKNVMWDQNKFKGVFIEYDSPETEKAIKDTVAKIQKAYDDYVDGRECK